MPEGSVWEFYRLMSAFLAANLLTVAFIYGVYSYTRREREGLEHTGGGMWNLATAGTALGFLAFGFYAWGFYS